MMKTIVVFLLIFLAPGLCVAEEVSGVSVSEMVFCRDVEQRHPVDADSHFSDTVGRVFCYTRISATAPPTHISHVWYYHDVRMAVVDLSVNAESWRTWSSKCIVREWTGTWRVDVLSEDGAVIFSEEFIITLPTN